jgi:hypothetical protein
MHQTLTTSGAATGSVRTVLRLEGLAMLATATTGYFVLGGNPWFFALLFFAPDLSFLFYTAGPRTGALAYNTVHSYLLPAVLGALGWLTGTDLLWQLALVFAAHIGFDRSFGYGLKYATAFNATHLGTVGKR